ncbi:hypothetical protein D3C85_1661300 [compost metagenome]
MVGLQRYMARSENVRSQDGWGRDVTIGNISFVPSEHGQWVKAEEARAEIVRLSDRVNQLESVLERLSMAGDK